MGEWEYKYRARVLRVVDGDTVDLELDCGLNIYTKQRLRLYGIDAPETYGVKKETVEYEAGVAATLFLKELIEGKEIVLVTHKDKTGKYGRYLGTIYIQGDNINQRMLKEGFARPY